MEQEKFLLKIKPIWCESFSIREINMHMVLQLYNQQMYANTICFISVFSFEKFGNHFCNVKKTVQCKRQYNSRQYKRKAYLFKKKTTLKKFFKKTKKKSPHVLWLFSKCQKSSFPSFIWQISSFTNLTSYSKTAALKNSSNVYKSIALTKFKRFKV